MSAAHYYVLLCYARDYYMPLLLRHWLFIMPLFSFRAQALPLYAILFSPLLIIFLRDATFRWLFHYAAAATAMICCCFRCCHFADDMMITIDIYLRAITLPPLMPKIISLLRCRYIFSLLRWLFHYAYAAAAAIDYYGADDDAAPPHITYAAFAFDTPILLLLLLIIDITLLC